MGNTWMLLYRLEKKLIFTKTNEIDEVWAMR